MVSPWFFLSLGFPVESKRARNCNHQAIHRLMCKSFPEEVLFTKKNGEKLSSPDLYIQVGKIQHFHRDIPSLRRTHSTRCRCSPRAHGSLWKDDSKPFSYSIALLFGIWQFLEDITWFADSVCVVTKEGRRIDAVIIGIASRIFSGGHGRIGFRVAAWKSVFASLN